MQRYLDTTFGNKYNFRRDVVRAMKEIATDAAKSIYTKISPGNPQNNF